MPDSVDSKGKHRRSRYTREQLKKLSEQQKTAVDDTLDVALNESPVSGASKKRPRPKKAMEKDETLLELVANVNDAMDELATLGMDDEIGRTEKKEADSDPIAKKLLYSFDTLVGFLVQFSDEMELLSTFNRKKDLAAIEALDLLITFAPMIDDVFVELKPILIHFLEEEVDEEMHEFLYGMHLTVDLLCEATYRAGERQEWNLRVNTVYVTLLELLSRDALEVACIFDDVDTPEYELTEAIEEAWTGSGHEEEFKTLEVTQDLTVFRQICYDAMLSMDDWCPDVDTLMDICGIDDTMLENRTVEDDPEDRMFETPETALQVLEKLNSDGLPRTKTMARIMRRIMPTDFITDTKLRDHISSLKGEIRDQLGLPVSNLIAISSVPEVLNDFEALGVAGVGKTTLAAMVSNHEDTRKFFNDGIAWIHIGQKEMTYPRYIQCLRELVAQLDIGEDEEPLFPELLHTPGESRAKRRRREEGFMMYAREIMVDFLQFRNVLIILDDVCCEPDLDWFDFDPAALQTDDADDEFSCVILVTTRCRNVLPAADTVEIDMLDEVEAVELIMQESGDLATTLAQSPETKSVVRECANHPLAVKSVGRWLNLKHATAGVNSSAAEIRDDVVKSMEKILKSGNQEDADMMYEILNMSLSPAINGEATNIIKFCFAAFVLVFCDKNYISDFALADATPIVPLSVAEILFESLLDLEQETLLQEGSLFYAQRKEAAVLIPEALSALGVLKVIITFTEVETNDDDSGSKPTEVEEKYLQVMHAIQEEYGEYLRQEDSALADLTKSAQTKWNRAFSQAYLATSPDWESESPDAGLDYAFEMIPVHMVLGGLLTETATLLSNSGFVRGRLFALGRENGTRRQIKDCELLFDRMMAQRIAGRRRFDPKATMKHAYKVLGGLLNMDEDEYIAEEGSTEALEVGRAHFEIGFSLAEKRCWESAIAHWETSQELLVSSLGMVELVAGIQLNVGVVYAEMNEYEQALNALKQCLRIRGAIHGEEHILYAQTIQKIGDIFLSMSDYHEAMESYNWALDVMHIEPSHHRIDIGDILENLGSIHYSKGEIDEALQCYQDALRSKEVDLGEDHPELATTFHHIGNCLSDQGNTEEAIAHFEEAVRLKEMDADGGGERDADVLTINGVLHNLNGRQQDGLECYEKALQILVTKVPHKKEKVASLLHLIGCVYLMAGEHKKAMKLFEESLQARRKVLGFVHLDVASTLFNMAFLHQTRNRLDKALKCLEEALKIRQLRLPDSEKVAITHEKIGTLARSIGKTKKSEIAFNEALRIRKLIHGDSHEAVATVLQELGDLMDDLGEYDEAMKHYVEALDIRQTQLGPDDLAVAETLYSMGFSLQNNEASGRALQCFEESLSIRKFQLGEDAKEVGDTLNMMGFLHAQRGELDEALSILWDALRVRKLHDDNIKVSETLKNIGNVHREKGEFDLAIECYEECLRIRRAELGENHEKVADVYVAIGNVQSDLDNIDEAMRSYEDGAS
jgi:tetratricopeptide (TPR) repeat protein